jgi:hypothetical protein
MGYNIASNPVGCSGIGLTNPKELVIRNSNSHLDACVGKAEEHSSVSIIEPEMSNILSFKKGHYLSWAWHVREVCTKIYSNESICKRKNKVAGLDMHIVHGKQNMYPL